MAIRIKDVACQFECEPLVRPFGFKGGYMHELWQVGVLLETDNGIHGLGLGTQSVLWSDPSVFASTSENEGNQLMFSITEYALQLIKGLSFDNPIELQEQIFDLVYAYGKKITGNPHLKKTFALNAMVAVDNAAWIVFARENGLTSFDEIIPAQYRAAFTGRHEKVASTPVVSYGMPLHEINELINNGYFLFSLKLGSPGSQQEMLEKDKERIEQIHQKIGDVRVSHTQNGKLPYYLDANGRYESKEALLKLLDHAKKIGAFDQILIVEEPFPEDYKVKVDDLGVIIAADESAHTTENVEERIKLGYQAIALKPAAKTLSTTLKMGHTAYKHSVPCFCADLTVNPILVDWNKNVAARLSPLPGLDIGVVGKNGNQNYTNWEQMKNYHPMPEASWINSSEGVFNLDDEYYAFSGGIMEDSQHYLHLLKNND